MTEPTFVYVVTATKGANTHVTKIGITGNVSSRLSVIKTHAPFEVDLYEDILTPTGGIAREVEIAIHNEFKARRFHGEWFNVHPLEAALMLVIKYGATMEARGIPEDEWDVYRYNYFPGKMKKLQRYADELEMQRRGQA